jgi:hypothetical protein
VKYAKELFNLRFTPLLISISKWKRHLEIRMAIKKQNYWIGHCINKCVNISTTPILLKVKFNVSLSILIVPPIFPNTSTRKI